MDEVIGKGKASRIILRNLIAGLFGFAVAFALVAVVLRVQDFLPSWYVRLLLFALPLPLAGGLAVGLVSPRKAIAWAPLWSAIFAVMLLAALSSLLHEVSAALSPMRIACIFAGAAICAGSGLLGQWVVGRGHVGKSVLVIVVVSLVLGGVGCILFQSHVKAFQRESVPQLVLEIDRDYISVPVNVDWNCRAHTGEGCYELACRRSGSSFRFYALADGSDISYIRYEAKAAGADISNLKAARACLRKIGVREPMLEGLSRVKGTGDWQSVLKGTRLRLWNNGHMTMAEIPPPAIDRSGGANR